MAECAICDDKGFLITGSGRKARIDLCQCRLEGCRCGGVSPYILYDEDGTSRCSCQPHRSALEKRRQRHVEAKLPKIFRWVKLGDFYYNEEHYPAQLIPPGNKRAFFSHLLEIQMKIASYLSDFDTDTSTGFFFSGRPGCGKSLVCCILINEIILKTGITCRFLKINSDFLTRMKAGFSNSPNSGDSAIRIFDTVKEIDFLVIDDFGVQKDTPWEQRTIYDLIDYRYENKKPTVFSSNKPLSDFSELSNGRIVSRIRGMCNEIPFDLPDYRLYSG
jgi:DNA replication protein DnaC